MQESEEIQCEHELDYDNEWVSDEGIWYANFICNKCGKVSTVESSA